MTALISIVSFMVIIICLVIAHELGHFITAKVRGVKVFEFGIGFPPRIFGVKRGDTIYSVNAIPLGGFVKLAGEEDPDVPGSLASKSIPTRLLVLSAGSIMNLLLPVVLFAISFMVPHQTVTGTVVVQQVAAGSPAAEAGLVAGDIITKVNGATIENISDLSRDLQLNLGSLTTLTIRNSDGAVTNVSLTPRWRPPSGQGATGIVVATDNAKIVRESAPFWQAIPMGVTDSIQTFILFKNAIIGMIIGAVPATFAGPVGIAQLTGQVAEAGMTPLLEFAAFLSINLGIFNIFPLPALDGGRIAFVLLEWVRRGKRIPAQREALIHFIGFVLIILFFIAITYQDIARIIAGRSLVG